MTRVPNAAATTRRARAAPDGYYGAHRRLATEDLDFVAFLGDYLYEGGASSGHTRRHDGPEAVDLDGYRRRYGLNKSDADLQACHVAHPWIVTWDDHEFVNNYARTRTRRTDRDAPAPGPCTPLRAIVAPRSGLPETP